MAAGVCGLVLALAVASVAAASHAPHLLQHSSIGPAGGNGAFEADGVNASGDGSTVVFSTAESLVPGDTDSLWDLYQRGPAGLALVSTGPGDLGTASGGWPSRSGGQITDWISPDGAHVIFGSEDRLTADDVDNSPDLYERVGGTSTRLVSTGSALDPDPGGPSLGAISADGSRVVFQSADGLDPADTDGGLDVYERFNGESRLVSTGPIEGPHPSWFLGASTDATRVVFQTRNPLVPEDSDTGWDLYVRSGGVTELVSTGPGSDNVGAAPAPEFNFMSAEGDRILFSTLEALVPDDTDNALDVYERSGGTTVIVTDGPGADTEQPSHWNGASADGTIVYFRSFQILTPEDTNGFTRDLYVRSGGVTRLVDLVHPAPASDFNVRIASISTNGERLVFETPLQLLPSDTDDNEDLYAYQGGTTTHLSRGPTGGNGALNLEPLHVSPEGARVLFATSESLVPGDTDQVGDIYEAYAGVTSLVSVGPAGGNGPFSIDFDGGVDASDDGSKVYFSTQEQLTASDTDSAYDVYQATIQPGHPRPVSASRVHVPLVPSYSACTAPNREHGPPLAHGSCAPPTPASPNLTIKAPGAGGARSSGFVRLNVRAGTTGGPDDTDVQMRFSLSNVMRASDQSEYTGEVRATAQVRVTDREGSVSSTIQDFPLEFDALCVPTPDPADKSLCEIDTDLDAVIPGATTEGTRAVWALEQIKVYDGGPDEDADTEQDNSLFAVQGVFVP